MSTPTDPPSPSAPDAPPDPDSLDPNALEPLQRAGEQRDVPTGIDDDADRARGDLDGVDRIADAHQAGS
jgi:hypothetical protein